MSKRITPATKLSDLKREAKRWLKALRANDFEARSRLDRAYPSAPSTPLLRDVQFALAREHGFSSWLELKKELQANATSSDSQNTLKRYEQMAVNLLDAYRTGTREAMERHWNDTWHRRSWQGMRRYVLADLGKSPERDSQQTDITLDEAHFLVAREAGFEDWTALSAYVSTLPVGKHAPAAKPVRLFRACSSDSSGEGERMRHWDAVIETLRGGSLTGLDAQGQMTDDVLKEISLIEHVTSLRLGPSPELTDTGVRHLARMPQLAHLDLGGCPITDRGLAFLSELRSLESLSLAGTRVTDSGLARLSNCEQLRRVDLSWTPTGDGTIRALAGMKRLHDFRSGMLVSNAGIPLLSALPVFRTWHGGKPTMALLSADAGPNYLSLRGTFTNTGLAKLADLHGLFALNLHDQRLSIDADGLRPLCALPHLGWLAYQANDEAMSQIAAMPNLRFLLCQDTTATDDGFRTLSRSRSLEYLWGGDCENLGDRGFGALAVMPSLRALSVSCAGVSDSALAMFTEFPVLRELMPMGIQDAGYRHVGECENLESLVLMYCRETTDAATESIGKLTNLTAYFASYTQITNRTPEILSRMDSLEKIELVGCAGVSNEGIAKLSRLPRLSELQLSGMRQVTREAVESFRKAVHVRLTP